VNGPLSQVADAFAHNKRSVPEIVRATSLNRDVVQACVEHLVSTGRLRLEVLSSGCPLGACGSCAAGSSCGHAAARPRTSHVRSY